MYYYAVHLIREWLKEPFDIIFCHTMTPKETLRTVGREGKKNKKMVTMCNDLQSQHRKHLISSRLICLGDNHLHPLVHNENILRLISFPTQEN